MRRRITAVTDDKETSHRLALVVVIAPVLAVLAIALLLYLSD
jgi:hypothetical protein